jgi:triosephosphate isomerase (TIM)
MLIVNFKAYENGVGNKAVSLAKIIEKEAKKANVKAVVGVQTADIYRVASNVKIEVIAQHLDPVKYGAFTGYILPESIKDAGGKGSLLNHSEFQINEKILKQCIDDCRSSGADFKRESYFS